MAHSKSNVPAKNNGHGGGIAARASRRSTPPVDRKIAEEAGFRRGKQPDVAGERWLIKLAAQVAVVLEKQMGAELTAADVARHPLVHQAVYDLVTSKMWHSSGEVFLNFPLNEQSHPVECQFIRGLMTLVPEILTTQPQSGKEVRGVEVLDPVRIPKFIIRFVGAPPKEPRKSVQQVLADLTK